jgi:uncharacterized protein with GYD domain
MRYVILTKLTGQGAKTIRENPERIKEVNAELESNGVKVIQQYAVLGEYDFVNVVEAENDVVVAKAMLDLTARGSIKTLTMPVISVDEFIENLKK